MFSRYQIVQNGLRHSKLKDKTDEELIIEFELEQKKLLEGAQIDPHNDPNNYSGLRKYFLLASKFCYELAHGKLSHQLFNPFIVAIIVFAGIVIGVESYPQMDENSILVNLDIFIFGAFLFEFVVKVLAEGVFPWRYLTGSEGLWNLFDFVVLVLSFPFLTAVVANKAAPFRIATRLFRLVRLAKIVNKLPALQVIIKGLVGGLKSINFIAMLLVLVYYLYAIMGVYFFRENDPFEFRNVLVAMLTLFRISTMESWADSFKRNVYGCAAYQGGLYFTEDMFPIEQGDMTYTWEELPSMFRCTHSTPSPVLAVLFFFSFELLAALVMLSLFVGVITMNMQQAMDSLRREGEDNARRHALYRHFREMGAMQSLVEAPAAADDESTKGALQDGYCDPGGDTAAAASRSESFSSRARRVVRRMSRSGQRGITMLGTQVSGLSGTPTSGHRRASLSRKERKEAERLEEMREVLSQAWYGTLVSEDRHSVDEDVEWSVRGKMLRIAAIWARRVSASPRFNYISAAIIIVASALIGLEANMTPQEAADPKLMQPYTIAENVVFAFFVCELVLHMLSVEFDLFEYAQDRWNIFDFAVVVGSKLPSAGAEIMVLRLVRILRVLKLLKAFPELGVIVDALIMGLSSIGYIAILMVLTYYMFGILALTFFEENDPFHFGRLHTAMYSLFQIATFDSWGDIMFTNIYGCNVYPPLPVQSAFQREQCQHPRAGGVGAAIFFIVFLVFGSLVLITLFVGVVTTSMDESQKHSKVEIDLEKRVEDVCETTHVGGELLAVYRRVFKMLDLDSSGTISLKELQICMRAVRIDVEEVALRAWVKEVDINNDGEVDIVEFILFMTNVRKRNLEKREAELSAIGSNKHMLKRLQSVSVLPFLSSNKDKSSKGFKGSKESKGYKKSGKGASGGASSSSSSGRSDTDEKKRREGADTERGKVSPSPDPPPASSGPGTETASLSSKRARRMSISQGLEALSDQMARVGSALVTTPASHKEQTLLGKREMMRRKLLLADSRNPAEAREGKKEVERDGDRGGDGDRDGDGDGDGRGEGGREASGGYVSLNMSSGYCTPFPTLPSPPHPSAPSSDSSGSGSEAEKGDGGDSHIRIICGGGRPSALSPRPLISPASSHLYQAHDEEEEQDEEDEEVEVDRGAQTPLPGPGGTCEGDGSLFHLFSSYADKEWMEGGPTERGMPAVPTPEGSLGLASVGAWAEGATAMEALHRNVMGPMDFLACEGHGSGVKDGELAEMFAALGRSCDDTDSDQVV